MISWNGDIRKGVEAWIKGLFDCQRIVIKRCVYDHIHEEVVECWLHGFADASKRGLLWRGVLCLVGPVWAGT